jgi:hypothetical protein
MISYGTLEEMYQWPWMELVEDRVKLERRIHEIYSRALLGINQQSTDAS